MYGSTKLTQLRQIATEVAREFNLTSTETEALVQAVLANAAQDKVRELVKQHLGKYQYLHSKRFSQVFSSKGGPAS